MIAISLDEEVVRLGETLRGRVDWSGQTREPKGVAVVLRWYTEGRGNQDRSEVAKAHQELEGPSAGLSSLAFSFDIPTDVPVNYDGMMIRLRWEVHVELDLPWGRNEEAGAEVWVLPR